MTRDDIIKLAREEAELYEDGQFFVCKHDELERFAALVAAAERIRFAEKCIDIVAFNGGSVEIEADIRSLVET